MIRLFLFLLALITHHFIPRHNAELRLLKAQIKILRERIPTKRIIPSAAEKAELVRLGDLCGDNVGDLIEIVKLATYRRWAKRDIKSVPFKNVGRPRLTQEIRDWVIKMGNDNLLWGYRRIVGEMKKLGFHLGETSVKRILKEAGIHPSPEKEEKKPVIPWLTFIEAHMESIVACDFFSKDIFTPLGKKTAYVLVFIHLDSRSIYSSSSTYNPNSDWVTQQARNANMWCHGIGVTPRFLLRDADTKFCGRFEQVWKGEGARILQIPHRAPAANAYCESLISSIKMEILDFFICVSRRQLDYIVKSWVRYYNMERPHQGKGIGNNVLDVDFKARKEGIINSREKLGGLIRSYYREAA